jgi:hypothetical protein
MINFYLILKVKNKIPRIYQMLALPLLKFSLHPLFSVRKKKRGKVGKLPTTVPEFVRRGVPEVYKRTAAKEPFFR